MPVKKKIGDRRNNNSHSNHEQSIAILALILNLIILPGLGSLIAGRIKSGVWQIILYLGGFLAGGIITLGGLSSSSVILTAFGIALFIIAPIVAWVWSIITGVKLIMEAHK